MSHTITPEEAARVAARNLPELAKIAYDNSFNKAGKLDYVTLRRNLDALADAKAPILHKTSDEVYTALNLEVRHVVEQDPKCSLPANFQANKNSPTYSMERNGVVCKR